MARQFLIPILGQTSAGVTPPVEPPIEPPDPGAVGELPAEIAAKTARVTTADAFQDALDDVNKLDGWTIYVDPPAGANWGQTFAVNKRVDTTKGRCVFRTETAGAVNLSGQLNFDINSSGVILWGFKRAGSSVRTNFAGKKNRIARSDYSGWLSYIALALLKGEDCEIWNCSFHDAADWTTAERNDYNAAGGGNLYPLRMSIRATVPNGQTYKNYRMDGLHIYSTNYYNFEPKINPADYQSCQNDTYEPAEDVDQAAGSNPVTMANHLLEKYLVEATHKQGLDNNGNPAKNGATVDLKAAGVSVKKATILCIGRMEVRGNGPCYFEDIYLECAGMDMSGGGPGPAGTPGHQIKRLNMVNGQWGQPKLTIIVGNGPPNTTQSQAGVNPFYQQCKAMTVEDVWGITSASLIGKQYKAADTFLVEDFTLRRFTGVAPTVAANKTINTQIIAGAPQGTKPVKLTRQECGVTAAFVDPEY